ncbi:MAG: ATP-binding protein [Candidatus Hydrothermarchaeota archaeon]|nr:ATP-binding protein [Candidatus Hydrothermarchaeota archaeon]
MSVFLNRERELSLLNERLKSRRAELVVIYGRRRIGKSELIEQFIKSNGIRLLAREESKTLQLRKFSEKLGSFFKDEFLEKTGFSNWDAFFEYLSKKSGERIVIAIDEFPYLIKEDPSLPSILQDYWDNKLKDTKIFLILSGSSISMMESKVLGYRSPLYGRRTGQLLLKPLRFAHVLDYIKKIEKAIEFYSVFGGTPAYIMEADPSKDIFKNIEEKILREDSFIYRDVEFVLRQELVEPRYYFSILLSIARGNHKIGLIVNDTGLSKSIVNKYLSILNDLQLVYRIAPITEGYKSRKGMYFLSDNMFDFWFRFVNPYTEEIEEGKAKTIVKNYVKPYFNQYCGKHFENIVQDVLGEIDILKFTRIGKWWHRDKEIDIIALNENTKEIMFCECKWQENVDALEVLVRLREKAKYVDWHRKKRKERYAIFAKSFSRRAEGNDVLSFNLRDLETALRKQKTK